MKSLEYHVAGQPVRVIIDGVPVPQGRTQSAKAAWFTRHADRYRRGLVLPPRGHADMSAVLLTEPSSASAHAGLVFLDAAGYPRLSLAGVIAAARAASEHHLISSPSAIAGGQRTLIFDTPAGAVTTRSNSAELAPRHVLVESLPAFVHAAGSNVPLAGRFVPVDLAFSGAFYALADGEAAGVVLELNRFEELRRIGRAVCAAVDQAMTLVDPVDSSHTGVAGVVFTGPPRDGRSHLRSVLVSAAGAVDVSPGLTAAPAIMAVLEAMGLIEQGLEFAHEGLSGAVSRGRLRTHQTVGDHQALVVELDGEAWATGEQTWVVDHEDPFGQGLLKSALS
jgi:proline racemase